MVDMDDSSSESEKSVKESSKDEEVKLECKLKVKLLLSSMIMEPSRWILEKESKE
jgi:hypothetical protein